MSPKTFKAIISRIETGLDGEPYFLSVQTAKGWVATAPWSYLDAPDHVVINEDVISLHAPVGAIHVPIEAITAVHAVL